jgi:hypothetical protein
VFGVALALVPAVALRPCGPEFDEAHAGYQERLQLDLLSICRDLFTPGASEPPSAQRIAELIAAADHGEPTLSGPTRWRELAVLATAPRLGDLDLLRTARDRLDLLPLVASGTIAPARWSAYCAWDGSDPAEFLGEDAAHNDALAVAALTTAAAHAIRGGDATRGLDLLARAQRHGLGVKRDEIEYLTVLAPVLAGVRGSGQIQDPRTALTALTAWYAAHQASPWRVQAEGWQAYLLWHHSDLMWGDGSAAVDQAARIWTRILLDPARHELFIPAVESLRWAWRRQRRSGQAAWTGGDARVVVAVASHALTDNENDEVALGTALGPLLALGDPGAQQLAPALAQAVAMSWFTQDPVHALPFARHAQATAPSAQHAYVLGRCAASAGDWSTVAAMAAACDGDHRAELLGRLGLHHEESGAWDAALRAYLDADAGADIGEAARYRVPLSVLETLWAAGRPATATQAAWAELTRCLAFRRVWAGRIAEAQTLFQDYRVGLCQRLRDLQAALAQATPAQRPAALLALARFWDDDGRRLLWGPYDSYDRLRCDSWQSMMLQRAERDPEAAQQVATVMHAMTAYVHSEPLYLELVATYPQAPEAAEALFRAGECRYWLCGTQWYGPAPYWEAESAAHGYRAEGQARLRRVAAEYPQSPFAQDVKVLTALTAAP